MKKILLLVFTFSYLSTSAQIKYVKVGGDGNGSGDSWGNAAADLKTVLDGSTGGAIIWVAKGTYKTIYTIDPTSAERALSFTIPNGVKVYGGFTGNEPSTFNLDSRDFNSNETILSGDIGIQGNKIDNSYHVVYTQNVSSATIVDGFTIQDGNASNGSPFPEDRGGGWFNTGRGLGNISNPIIRNIIFKNNDALLKGGALCNDGYEGNASPIILKCMFINNTSDATTGNGGAMYNEGLRGIASPLISNCVFSNNSAGKGGAIYNDGDEQFSVAGLASPAIINSTFYANSGNSGNVIYNTANMGGIAKPTIWNCIFYGSSSPLIENANTAEAIIDHIMVNVINLAAVGTSFTDNGGSLYNANPLFQDAINDNFQLKAGSPAINSGDNTAVEADLDLAGKPRIKSSKVDIGAYESPGIIYVDASKTAGVKSGFSWANAFIDLQDALAIASPKDTIWVAKGTYKPTSSPDRTISFVIPDSVKVYGGFAGTEATNYNLDLRDFTANETNLSGDIGNPTNSMDNSYHVVYTKNVSSETVVDGITITRGNANGTTFLLRIGAAWFNDGSGSGNSSNPTLTNCTFTSNTASRGGAMLNDGAFGGESSPTLTNCTFTSNTASADGGAMYNFGEEGTSSPTLTNCTFDSNTASRGGATFNDGAFDGESSPTLTNCTFTSNTANNDGGAMYNSGFEVGTSSPTLTNCTFTSNTASDNGGAMYNNGLSGPSSPTLTNCTFDSNTASRGGATFNDGAFDGESSPTLTNCTFTSNTANIDGGAMYNSGFEVGTSIPTLTNCTFTSNTASDNGGAMYNDGSGSGEGFEGSSNPILTNCILWGNSANSVANSFYNNDATVIIAYSLVQEANCTALSVGISSTVNCSGTMIYNQNPLFVNAAAGNFKLQNNSPAIDVGTNTGIVHISDIIGQKHLNTPDMGAYENACSKIQIITTVPTINNGEYTSKAAVNTLQAANVINNTSNVYYQAGKSITLNPGFVVAPANNAATVFEAKIANGCL